MCRRLIASMLVLLLALPLFSQSYFEYNLAKHKGNKIILLGEWKPQDADAWRQALRSDGLHEHNFAVLNRQSFAKRAAGL
jgi:hypothetical protein